MLGLALMMNFVLFYENLLYSWKRLLLYRCGNLATCKLKFISKLWFISLSFISFPAFLKLASIFSLHLRISEMHVHRLLCSPRILSTLCRQVATVVLLGNSISLRTWALSRTSRRCASHSGIRQSCRGLLQECMPPGRHLGHPSFRLDREVR